MRGSYADELASVVQECDPEDNAHKLELHVHFHVCARSDILEMRDQCSVVLYRTCKQTLIFGRRR